MTKTKQGEVTDAASGLRADARRNRERILAAARDLFIERGPDASLEAIAARAGVGIATLYRRFPDRRALTRAVALDVLSRVADEARLAQTEEPVAFQALARYMQRVLDLRVAAVIPALLGRVALDDAEIFAFREQTATLVQEMIERAQADGSLRPDVAFGDISLLLIRLSRPLPGPFSRGVSDRLAHRHLEIVLDGLRVDHRPLPGPAMTLDDLRALSSEGNRTGSDQQEDSDGLDHRSSSLS